MAFWRKKPQLGWIKKAVGKLGALFAPAPSLATDVNPEEHYWVDLELGQLLSSDPDQPMHIVSLREYSSAIGENWETQGPKIMTMAESILRRLVQFGACISAREDYFIITFKPQFRAKSQLRIFEASIELGQRLVGAKFKVVSLEEESPSVAVAEAQVRDLLGADGELDMNKLAAMISGATSVQNNKTPILQAIQAATADEPVMTPISSFRRPTQAAWEAMQRERQKREEIRMIKIEAPVRKRSEPVWLPMGPKQTA